MRGSPASGTMISIQIKMKSSLCLLSINFSFADDGGLLSVYIIDTLETLYIV